MPSLLGPCSHCNIMTVWQARLGGYLCMRCEQAGMCYKCHVMKETGGWGEIDLLIYHQNNHRWPGFAGRDEVGGSDF